MKSAPIRWSYHGKLLMVTNSSAKTSEYVIISKIKHKLHKLCIIEMKISKVIYCYVIYVANYQIFC